LRLPLFHLLKKGIMSYMQKKLFKNSHYKLLTIKKSNFNGVYLNITFEIGALSEGSNVAGINHFAEHLIMRCLINKYSSDRENNHILQSMSGHTHKDRIFFDMYFEKKMIPHAIKIIKSFRDPLIITEEIMRLEKSIILEEILEESNSGEADYQKTVGELIYGSGPLSTPILGNKKSIRAFNVKDMQNQIKKIVSSPIIITVVGDIDIRYIKSAFGPVKANNNIKKDLKPCLAKESFKMITKKKSQISMGMYSGILGQISFDDLQKWLFARDILEQYLYEEIRENGLCYSLDISIATYKKQRDLGIEASFEPKKFKVFYNLIQKKIREFEDWLNEDKFLELKNEKRLRLALGEDDILSYGGNYAWYVHVVSDCDAIKSELAVLPSINRQDIIKIIQTLFSDKKTNLLIVGNLTKDIKKWTSQNWESLKISPN